MRALSRFWQYTKPVMSAAACLVLVMSIASCGKIKEEEAYIYGMESYVYGYPIVVMNVTREVLTAAPAPNAEGTAAPIRKVQ